MDVVEIKPQIANIAEQKIQPVEIEILPVVYDIIRSKPPVSAKSPNLPVVVDRSEVKLVSIGRGEKQPTPANPDWEHRNLLRHISTQRENRQTILPDRVEKDPIDNTAKQKESAECSQKVLELQRTLEAARTTIRKLQGIEYSKEEQLRRLESLRKQLALKQQLIKKYKNVQF